MDNTTRLQYLEAMGIDVWVARHRLAVEQAVEASENVGYPQGRKWAEHSEAHQESLVEPATNFNASQHIGGEHGDDQQRWAPLHSAIAPGMVLPPASMQSSAQPTGSSHTDEQSWKGLQQEVSICRACPLCETRTQTVFGVGSHHASWMLIGEAPGQNEDLQGEPFVGRAGQLLTEMLRAIGLTREEVFIANVLKCRPPHNRDPQASEVAACRGFLQRQIELLRPKIILAVGRIAAQNLLDTQQPLAKLRGVRHRLDDIPLLVVHHPAYLLRTPIEKAKAWEDLQFAVSVYQSLP